MLKVRMSPSMLLAIVYGTFIVLGAVFLKLPISTNEPIRWIDSLFTSASAMTVTGLGVVDTGTHFTRFGQVVIMVLIQVGGLGIMSFAMLLFVMLRKKIGLKQRLIMKQALNQVHVGGVIRLVKYLFVFSILIEAAAMLVLAIEWVPKFGVWDGLFYSFFHSVSAFNNAGFALWSDGLSQFAGSPVINLTIMSLIILGGIGFTVIVEVWQRRKWRAFSLHTKVMLQATLILNMTAAVLFFGLERMNPGTIGTLSGADQFWTSLFQAVTTRTAGFNTVDISGLEHSTAFLFMILMFIGGGSGSTAGGIKLTTFVVMLVTMLTYIRGRKNIHLYQRTIHQENVLRVLSITMISTFTVAAGILLLNVTEDLPFLPVMFEVVSAFGTVGLSMGITGDLSVLGKLIVIGMMIIGKLGPLSLVYMLAKQEDCKYRYPNEDILTG